MSVSLVRLQNISKRYEEHVVLREIFFRLSEGQRIGLIGKNGTGKTTVLRLILGQEEPTEGNVELAPDITIGYFSQFSELNGEQTIFEILDEVFSEIHIIEEQLLDVEIQLEQAPQGKQLDRLLNHQAQLFEEMERCGGWTYPQRIDTVLTKLGFSDVYRKRPISQLSGGWRNRAALAKLLLQEPDVLLLDEPTNYLDITGLTWLEDWLKQFRGALILVSHDRHFLDQVVHRIVEIENYHFQEYEGNFTEYIRQKRGRIKELERQFEHEEDLLAFESEAIKDRREAAKDPTRALQRKLANIKKRAEPRPVDKIITDLYQGIVVPDVLCRVTDASKSYDHQTIFANVSFKIHQGDRIAVIGPNGCGKTTLLRVLTGQEEGDGGKVIWGRGDVPFAYYNQILEELDLDDTVTHAVNVVRLAYFAPRKRVNRFLSLMRFSDMDLKQIIGTLSGGQKARVALAQCLLSGAPIIILDEPTNHLDLTSTQVMERALVNFPGAVLVVSHDRFFIDKIATRLLVFEADGHVREVNGNWSTWAATRESSNLDLEPAADDWRA